MRKSIHIRPDPTTAKASKPVHSASQPGDIVLIEQKSDPRVDSRLIAQQLGKKHRSIYRLIADHQEDYEVFGILRFEIAEIDGRGQPERFALLNEDQSYLLLTYTRNTDQTRRLKVALVKAFGQARRTAADRLSHQAEPGWRDARIDTKRGHHMIGFAVRTTRLLAGKEIRPFHYSNEARLIAFAMLGTTQDHLCRDCMGRDELRVLAKVERFNAEMIALGESYAVRKGKARLYALQLLADLQRRGCVLLHANPAAMLEGLV